MNLKCQSQTVDLHVFKVKAFPFWFYCDQYKTEANIAVYFDICILC